MSVLPAGKAGVAGFALFSVAWLGVACSLDITAKDALSELPITANVLAGVALLPLELLVVYVLVERVLSRQRQRRWAGVVDELTSAIGGRWGELRDLLVARYGLDKLDDSRQRIAIADGVWAALQAQEAAVDEYARGTELVEWVLPEGAAERLAGVGEVWGPIWGAGAETMELSLESRLTNVLLPRLAPEDPHLTSAVRRLIDAIGDLTDVRRELDLWSDPFPDSPFVEEPDAVGRNIMAAGAPEVSRDALRLLGQLLDAAEQVVRRGDQLEALLASGSAQILGLSIAP